MDGLVDEDLPKNPTSASISVQKVRPSTPTSAKTLPISRRVVLTFVPSSAAGSANPELDTANRSEDPC